MTQPVTSQWSIRWRILRGVLAIVTIGWIGTMLLALFFLNREMSEASDGQMIVVARTTLIAAETASGMAIPRIVGLGDTEDDEDVSALMRLSVHDRPAPDGPWPRPATDGFSDTGDWRVFRLSGEDAVIEVGQSKSQRREELLEAGSALLMLVLPMLMLLVWGITRTLTRTLAPVEQVASGIGRRKPDDLSPVPPDTTPRELRPLIEALNTYLARIDALRQSERRFVANAAHELRTPVASIRASLEQGTNDPAAAIRLLDDLTRRIERLLQLARSEAGLGLGRGPVDLVRIIRLLTDETGRRTSAKIQFDDADLETLIVPFDPDAVAILLRNLIENAVDHGTGQVRILLTRAGRITIENPTENSGFLDAAFSKGPKSNGAGLGLSIVDSLSSSMGIRTSKTLSNGIARIELDFPAARSAPGHSTDDG